ncbi:translation elongation factor Ts [Candidatus Magnetaquicoccus inordinatus]|uniref:translation elongation factor Ts n=1 Tax=Candidatus Magnetaquicoccus inordinatus TaxID=2496818 RepID=UPI00102CD7AE|nr:translation elongation factor Ts [Candidatus Magnetaquicoccus inordinatus]
MSVSAKLVKDLREQSGAGMMDCKKALEESNGDMEAAVDWLRKKGLSSASKKSGRVAAEGKVVAVVDGNQGILLEVNTETDFTSKNENFVAFAETSARVALAAKVEDVEALKSLAYPESGRNVADELTHKIATIGENMNLRRLARVAVSEGVVVSYIHMEGKIGVLVGVQSPGTDKAALADLGKKLAMHVAASAPPWLDRSAVPAEALERERAILAEQARASGKPENIIEKMVLGRLDKFYGESCLLEQPFVMDPDQKVISVVEARAKELATTIQITAFVRFVLGDGIQKKEEDFAAEVAKAAG